MPRTRCGLNGCSTHIDWLTNFSSGATTRMSSRSPASARSASKASNPATPPPTMITRSRMLSTRAIALVPVLHQQEDAVQHRVREGEVDRHGGDQDPVLADSAHEHHHAHYQEARNQEAEQQSEPHISLGVGAAGTRFADRGSGG